jgi:serine/threonine protein kinase
VLQKRIQTINDYNQFHILIHTYNKMIILGTGTFGRVCIARTEKSDDYYAIKMLSIIDVIHKKQTEHVKSEKNILLQISHPFVINM